MPQQEKLCLAHVAEPYSIFRLKCDFYQFIERRYFLQDFYESYYYFATAPIAFITFAHFWLRYGPRGKDQTQDLSFGSKCYHDPMLRTLS